MNDNELALVIVTSGMVFSYVMLRMIFSFARRYKELEVAKGTAHGLEDRLEDMDRRLTEIQDVMIVLAEKVDRLDERSTCGDRLAAGGM